MTFASDPIASGKRIETLRHYMTEHVLGASGHCICRNLDSCRRSVLFDRQGATRSGAAFAAGQLSHVGHHYDLVQDGVKIRTLVIAMETGRSREGVTLEQRHAELMQSAKLAFTARSPHVAGRY